MNKIIELLLKALIPAIISFIAGKLKSKPEKPISVAQVNKTVQFVSHSEGTNPVVPQKMDSTRHKSNDNQIKEPAPALTIEAKRTLELRGQSITDQSSVSAEIAHTEIESHPISTSAKIAQVEPLVTERQEVTDFYKRVTTEEGQMSDDDKRRQAEFLDGYVNK